MIEAFGLIDSNVEDRNLTVKKKKRFQTVFSLYK